MTGRRNRRAIERHPRRFYNGCVGKKALPSRRAALGVIRVMGDQNITAYKCPFCKSWHVGH